MVYRRRRSAGPMVKGKKYRYRRGRLVRRKGRVARKTGFLNIIRKCKEFSIENSTVANTPVLCQDGGKNNYTGNILQIGNLQADAAGTYAVPFSMQFSLDQLLNYADITGIADQYKIKSVYVRVWYNGNSASVGGLNSMPYLQYITDHDDSVVPTVSNLREKMGVKMKTFRNGGYIGIKVNPKAAVAQGGSSAPSLLTKGWTNSAYPSILHYGIKGCVSNMNLPTTTTSQIAVKFDVAYTVVAKDFQ